MKDMQEKLNELDEAKDKINLKIQELEDTTNRKQEEFERKLKKFDDQKEDFGDKLQAKLSVKEMKNIFLEN